MHQKKSNHDENVAAIDLEEVHFLNIMQIVSEPLSNGYNSCFHSHLQFYFQGTYRVINLLWLCAAEGLYIDEA